MCGRGNRKGCGRGRGVERGEGGQICGRKGVGKKGYVRVYERGSGGGGGRERERERERQRHTHTHTHKIHRRKISHA